MNTATVLWAVKIGEPDYAEQIITTCEDRIEAAKLWAQKNGFNRFRVAVIDLDQAPDFKRAINFKGLPKTADDPAWPLLTSCPTWAMSGLSAPMNTTPPSFEQRLAALLSLPAGGQARERDDQI